MNKKFEILNLFWGALGILLICVSQNGWGAAPAVGLAVTSIFFIRRESSEEELPMAMKQKRRTLNIISVVCWVIAAVLCYFLATNLRENGLWFVLASYIFLVVHGVLFVSFCPHA
ncbi:MAG: hypothetical protein J6T87_01135 [Bacteroidales bacterium]|nr:hypothetical protein [Bacteroidales bacterium]